MALSPRRATGTQRSSQIIIWRTGVRVRGRRANKNGKLGHGKAQAKTIFSKLLEVSATVQINQGEVIVSLDKRAHNPHLVASQLTDQPVPMPWLGDQRLLIRFA